MASSKSTLERQLDVDRYPLDVASSLCSDCGSLHLREVNMAKKGSLGCIIQKLNFCVAHLDLSLLRRV